jgi:REP element-mobilizing transposase RayT
MAATGSQASRGPPRKATQPQDESIVDSMMGCLFAVAAMAAPTGFSYASAQDMPMVGSISGSQHARMEKNATLRKGHAALRRGRVSLPNQVYHLTTRTVARAPVFADPTAARAACACFVDPATLGVATMLAWVLMPDHAHWLLQLGEAEGLEVLVSRLKGASACQVNAALGRHGPVWQRGFYDRALRSDEDMVVVARYIIANPLRSGLVERIGDYPYWDAVWL